MTISEKVAKHALGVKNPDGIRWPQLIAAFLAAFIIAIPLYAVATAVIDRQPPIYYIEAFAPNPEVRAGEAVDIRFDVQRRRICQIMRLSRYVVDESGVEHAVSGYTVSNSTRPGRETYDRQIVVPESVPPDPATYYLRIQYGCNFLNFLGWPIRVESPHVPLVILPPA